MSKTRATKDYRNTKGRFRVCTFTLNNFTILEYEKIISLEAQLKILIFQSEIGNNGTPHLQGMAQISAARTLSSWKKLFGSNKIHIEQCRNIIASKKYCQKEDTWDSKIRFVKTDEGITTNIYDVGADAAGSLTIYTPAIPKEIIDYKRMMIYMDDDENINYVVAKKKFLNYTINSYDSFLEKHYKNLI